MISVFGASGFIGNEFCKNFPKVYCQERGELEPHTNNLLYFISTTDNYNIFFAPLEDINTNLLLLVKTLEETRKKFGSDFTFNFISSWFVYGKGVELPAKEDSMCEPLGFYSVTKYAAERLLQSYCTTFGAKYRILRLANVMGYGDKNASLKKNAVQYLLQEIKAHREVAIYDAPSFRDFIDVRDCVSAIDLVIRSGKLNEIYNIGNGEAVNVKRLIENSDPQGKYIKYKPVPEFHTSMQSNYFYLDITKIRSLGYKRKFELGETIKWINDDKQ